MPILLACSGPGAGAAIALNLSISFALAAVALLLVVSLVLRSLATEVHGAYCAASAILFVFHPAWWLGAASVDCGEFQAESSLVVGVVALVVVASQASGTVKARRRTPAWSVPVGPTSFPPPEA